MPYKNERGGDGGYNAPKKRKKKKKKESAGFGGGSATGFPGFHGFGGGGTTTPGAVSEEALKALAELMVNPSSQNRNNRELEQNQAKGGKGKAPSPQRIAPKINLKPKKKNEPEPEDQLDALFNELLGSIGETQTFDYETALAESEAAIRAAYAGDIANIRGAKQSARKQTARDRREMERMYNALGRSYEKQAKREGQLGAGLAKQMQNMGQSGAEFVKDTASGIQKEQAEMVKGLGIEESLPALAAEQAKKTQKDVTEMGKEATRDGNRQRAFSGNQQRFLRRGGQTARLEGTNRSADLLEQLGGYLQAKNDEISGLKSDRMRELAANRGEVMSSVAELNQDAQQDTWEKLNDLYDLRLKTDDTRQDNQLALDKFMQSMQPDPQDAPNMFPGLSNVANAEQYLQRGGPDITQAFESLLGSRAFREGTFTPEQGGTAKMTVYQAMKMAEDMGRKYNLSASEVQLLKLAIQAQMG